MPRARTAVVILVAALLAAAAPAPATAGAPARFERPARTAPERARRASEERPRRAPEERVRRAGERRRRATDPERRGLLRRAFDRVGSLRRAAQEKRSAARAAKREARRIGETAVEPVRLSRGIEHQPLEVQLLMARAPRARAALTRLERRGVPVRLERVTRTPGDVLDAIGLVSVVTQENNTLNWLPQLVQDGHRPVLKPTEAGMRRARELGLVPPSGEIDPARLQRAVDRIERGAEESLRLVVGENAAGVDAKSPELVELNRALEPTRRLWASRRIVFDIAQDQTEGARSVIKKMMVLGPAAHGLEMLHLGAAAALLAGSSDDILGEVAQLKALRGAGFSRRELWQRLKVLGPVGLGAMALSAGSHALLKSGHPLAAGAAFGVSAVALSITSAVQSVRMYRKAYDVLLRDGKIPGKVGPMMKREVQAELHQMDRQLRRLTAPEHRVELMALVGRTLDSEVAAGAMTRAAADRLVSDLGRLDLRDLRHRITRPGSLASWKQAVAQAFSNPATRGMAVGAGLAPFLGMAAAHGHLLENGFVLTLVGSSESLIAGATVFAAGKLEQMGYRRALERELRAARAHHARPRHQQPAPSR